MGLTNLAARVALTNGRISPIGRRARRPPRRTRAGAGGVEAAIPGNILIYLPGAALDRLRDPRGECMGDLFGPRVEDLEIDSALGRLDHVSHDAVVFSPVDDRMV